MDKYKILAVDHEEIKKVQVIVMNDLLNSIIDRRNDIRFFTAESSCIELIKRQLSLDNETDTFICLNKKMIIANVTDSNYLDNFVKDRQLKIESIIDAVDDQEVKDFYQWLLSFNEDLTFIELYAAICKKFAMLCINKTLDRIAKNK